MHRNLTIVQDRDSEEFCQNNNFESCDSMFEELDKHN